MLASSRETEVHAHISGGVEMARTYGVTLQFPIGPDVEETTRRIIRPGTEGVAVGEELDGVDVRVVRSKRLHTLLLSYIPQLSECVAGSRHKLVVVEWVYAQAHDVAKVVRKLMYLCAAFHIPQDASHVSRRGKDSTVVDESTAAEVSRVAGQLTSNPCWSFSR